jgi:tRNA-specific 2-thiouridylase
MEGDPRDSEQDEMSDAMTVAVGMSGGVDSTMAAWMLKQQGHDVVGLTMQLSDGLLSPSVERRSGCYGPGEVRDIAAAKAAAERIGIPHVTVTLAEEFRRCVLDYFREEYRAGRTPNPCVVCNREMKFGLLIERARQQGVRFDFFATGHYARVEFDEGRGLFRLLRGIDPSKDQSYFLARLTQDQLRQVLFPLGDWRKEAIISLAREVGLGEIADREESQDFLEGADYAPLFEPSDSQPGPIRDSTGRMLGRHRGIIHYTIGQRKGLGIASTERLYVKELQVDTNTIVLGRRDEVMMDSCRVEDASWISGAPPDNGTPCLARLRYRHCGANVTLHRESDEAWRAEFKEPQFAVAPGQAAVFYDGDEVLGGGWIGRRA